EVYNSMGQKIAILVNKEQTAGDYSVHFNASSFNSGVYYYSLKTSKFKQTKKMVLIK
ncbi:MAG: T9SS type A sorting domain-containing protein, partial [Calditrichia bacterium]|nr:T9SS type A sorting domain-containing protein [Calditrichia bacterium]